MAQENKIVKVGHRGAMGYEPENTLRSFKKAMELGADMIELDVHICKSGELVINHEFSIDGTDNGRNMVSEKTLSELKNLDMGKGEKITTLPEVLDFFDKRIKVNIELKGRVTAKPVAKIIKEYVEEKGWKYNDFLVSSFFFDELEKIAELNPEIKTGVLTMKITPEMENFAKKIKAHSLNVSMEKATKQFVDEAHANGFKVFVWTPNTSDEIEKTKLAGADYICSDFPEKI